MLLWDTCLAVALLLVLTHGQTLSDELDSRRNSIPEETLPWLQDFPLPITRQAIREEICQYQPFRLHVRVKRREWMDDRTSARLHYESAKRSCCLLEIPLVSLHSCIDGHRRDVINTYCSKELQHDVTGSRAHPCCFSLSSQRYLCFERYHYDVMNLPVAPSTDSSDVNTAEKKSRDFRDWLTEVLRNGFVCDATSRTRDQQNSASATISMRAYQPPDYLVEGAQRNVDCCDFEGDARADCFIIKRSDLYEAFCTEHRHFCCHLFGQAMYDCFRTTIISQEQDEEENEKGDSKDATKDVSSDDISSSADDVTAMGKINVTDDGTGEFDDTLVEYDDTMRESDDDVNGEENMEIEVINDVIAQEDENEAEDQKDENLRHVDEITITPTNVTEEKKGNGTTKSDESAGNPSESIAVNQSLGSPSSNSTVDQMNRNLSQEQTNETNRTAPYESSKKRKKQKTFVRPINPKSFLRCCKFGGAVGSRRKDRTSCSVKNLVSLIKRNRNLSSQLLSRNNRRNCLLSMRRCCLRETQHN